MGLGSLDFLTREILGAGERNSQGLVLGGWVAQGSVWVLTVSLFWGLCDFLRSSVWSFAQVTLLWL